jgi:hypothetical protein
MLKMNKTTRRNFIGTLAGMAATPVIGRTIMPTDDFQDIRVDRYYVLQGGKYGDTGGIGKPGYMWGQELVDEMAWHNQCLGFEDFAENVEKHGYYFSQSQYFGKFREYEKLRLTKDWIFEFYKRHKDDTFDMWKSRYDEYMASLESQGYRLVNGRFCNPEMGY